MVSSGAYHSPPAAVVRLNIWSTDVHSQAISSWLKLPASIWSSGEYFCPAVLPA